MAGSALGLAVCGNFSTGLFVLALVAIVFLHSGANLANDYFDHLSGNDQANINPTVTPSGELGSIEEGCLSVPGIFTKIRRYKKCKVTATGLDGNEFTEQAEGLYARALQHEYDHIEGMTIANRMSQTARIAHRRQLKKLAEKNKDKQ